METIRCRIIDYLASHPEGVDDDQLAKSLHLKQRQQANARCRQLEIEGCVERRRVNGKIRNVLIVSVEKANQGSIGAVVPQRDNDARWCWEGNVQATIVDFLKAKGYRIDRVADTASKEQGKDIEANINGRVVWVTVKGYPKGTTKTAPSTQAGHWFKQALYDLVKWRGMSEDAIVVLGLPDFPRYRRLFLTVKWAQEILKFTVLWVKEASSVEMEGQTL